MLAKLAFFAVYGLISVFASSDTLAYPGQFPYQASIQLDGKHKCSGSIISSTEVLTTAECLLDKDFIELSADRLSVVVGTINNSKGGVRVPVATISVNPEYNFDIGNITAVTLASVLPPDAYQAIELQTSQVPAGSFVLISAWRQDTAELTYNTFKTLSPLQCAQHNLILTNLVLCVDCLLAKNCNYEQGAPVIALNGKLAGVASIYGISANIAEHMPFINSVLE